MMRADLAEVIEHTLLWADATHEDLSRHCTEAVTHGFSAVCVNSANVGKCRELGGNAFKLVSTVGFPLGASSIAAKVAEAAQAVRDGATEIDMVLRVGDLKSGDRATVLDDIRAVVAAVDGRVVKVILETALLTDDEKKVAAEVSKRAGASFVKTSTGFGRGGATIEDVRLLRSAVGHELGVKASGGIRDAAAAYAMLEAGASRLGTSASVAIVTGAQVEQSSGEY